MLSDKPKIQFSKPADTLPDHTGLAKPDANGQLKIARVVPDYRMALLLCGLAEEIKRPGL